MAARSAAKLGQCALYFFYITLCSTPPFCMFRFLALACVLIKYLFYALSFSTLSKKQVDADEYSRSKLLEEVHKQNVLHILCQNAPIFSQSIYIDTFAIYFQLKQCMNAVSSIVSNSYSLLRIDCVLFLLPLCVTFLASWNKFG